STEAKGKAKSQEEPSNASDWSRQQNSTDSFHMTTGPSTNTPFHAERREEMNGDHGETPSTSRISDHPHHDRASTSSSTDDVFKKIMRSAKSLIDPNYKEPPLPKTTHEWIKSARQRKPKKLTKAMSIFEDTTKV
ncbi:hypothetical protein PFISCL1PPCAC_25330, partial [Pristionchus fissidentatus]